MELRTEHDTIVVDVRNCIDYDGAVNPDAATQFANDFVDATATRRDMTKDSAAITKYTKGGHNGRVDPYMLFMPNTSSNNFYMEPRDGAFWIFGATIDGKKVGIKLRGIRLTLDIMVQYEMQGDIPGVEVNSKRQDGPTKFYRDLMSASKGSDRPESFSVVSMYPLKGFHTHPVKWVRLQFRNSYSRAQWMRHNCTGDDKLKYGVLPMPHTGDRLKGKPLITSGDDASDDAYFNKVARENNFNTVGWNIVRKFTTVDTTNPNCPVKNCEAYEVDVADYRAIDADTITGVDAGWPKADRDELTQRFPNIPDMLLYDRTVVASVDIETESGTGDIPARGTEYEIFNINVSFMFRSDNHAVVNYSLVIGDINVPPRNAEHAKCKYSYSIVCKDQKQMAYIFVLVMGNMRPDFTMTFNGSNFDWPLLCELMEKNGYYVMFDERVSTMPRLRPQKLSQINNRPTYESAKADITSKKSSYCRSALFIERNFKINAEMKDEKIFYSGNIPGILDIDMMYILKKMNAKAEVQMKQSLNYFLDKYKLPKKIEMDYKVLMHARRRGRLFEQHVLDTKLYGSCHCDKPARMKKCPCCVAHDSLIDCEPILDEKGNWKSDMSGQLIDETALRADIDGVCCMCGKYEVYKTLMGRIAEYCWTDCLRPQQLQNRCAVIPDKRELSNLTRVPLLQSFYMADSSKVCNFVGVICRCDGVAYTSRYIHKDIAEKEHYPGAYVKCPHKGVHTDRPITGIDFSSLYPSITMANNCSPDMVVDDPKEAARLRKAGYVINTCEFDYERGETKGNPNNFRGTLVANFVAHRDIIIPAKVEAGEAPKKSSTGWKRVHTYFNALPNKTDADKALIDAWGGRTKVLPDYDDKLVFKYDVDPESLEVNICDEEKDFHVASKMAAAIVEKYVEKRKRMWGLDKFKDDTSDEYKERIAELGCDGIDAKSMITNYAKLAKRIVSRERIHDGPNQLPGQRMGVTARVSEILIQLRIPVKKEFLHIEEILETMKKAETEYADYHGRRLHISDLQLRFAAVNAKQIAIKIVNNTLYGTGGNMASPLYYLAVAGGITTYGQQCIKAVDKLVIKHECEAAYGDTDSLYIKAPLTYYKKERDEWIAACERIGLPDNVRVRPNGTLYRVYEAPLDCPYALESDLAGKTLRDKAVEHNNADLDYLADLHGEESRKDVLLKCAKLADEGLDANFIVPDFAVREIKLEGELLAAREKYWTVMVERTMVFVANFVNVVADMLAHFTNGLYLKMAYEEVGFPTVMCGKKKYFMTPHANIVNFNARPFLRGMDFIKQGKSKKEVDIGKKMVARLLSPRNIDGVAWHVRRIVRELATVPLHTDQCIIMKKYKRKNGTNAVNGVVIASDPAINAFLLRMDDMKNTVPTELKPLYDRPDLGDKFPYVICKPLKSTTIMGLKSKAGVGNNMYYSRIYKAGKDVDADMFGIVPTTGLPPIEIDYNYYLEKYAGGIARFAASVFESNYERGISGPKKKRIIKARTAPIVREAAIAGYGDNLMPHEIEALGPEGFEYKFAINTLGPDADSRETALKVTTAIDSALYRTVDERAVKLANTYIKTIITDVLAMTSPTESGVASTENDPIVSAAKVRSIAKRNLDRIVCGFARKILRDHPELGMMVMYMKDAIYTSVKNEDSYMMTDGDSPARIRAKELMDSAYLMIQARARDAPNERVILGPGISIQTLKDRTTIFEYSAAKVRQQEYDRLRRDVIDDLQDKVSELAAKYRNEIVQFYNRILGAMLSNRTKDIDIEYIEQLSEYIPGELIEIYGAMEKLVRGANLMYVTIQKMDQKHAEGIE